MPRARALCTDIARRQLAVLAAPFNECLLRAWVRVGVLQAQFRLLERRYVSRTFEYTSVSHYLAKSYSSIVQIEIQMGQGLLLYFLEMWTTGNSAREYLTARGSESGLTIFIFQDMLSGWIK